MLGWPVGAHEQVNRNCYFGAMEAVYLKYESSTRGGLHAHGQMLQKMLQAEHLRMRMQEGSQIQAELYRFFEGVMMAYFPVPTAPPTPAGPSGDSWAPAMPLLQGERTVTLVHDDGIRQRVG